MERHTHTNTHIYIPITSEKSDEDDGIDNSTIIIVKEKKI